MILPKLSYIIVFLWLVLRGIQINKESKLNLFYATTKVLGPPCVYKARRVKKYVTLLSVHRFVHGLILLQRSSLPLILVLLANDVEMNPGPYRNSSSINIAHLNIRSLKNREHYILAKDIVIKYKLDVFTVSETWLDSTVPDVEVEFPGFKIHRLDRETKTGGGICVFAKQDFRVERLSNLSYITETGLHMLWLKIQVRNWKTFLVCTTYKPPNVSLNCFDTDFSYTLIEALSLNKPVYILGDLNCNMLNVNDPACQSLAKFCSSFNLSQLINQPTRVTENSKTLIDVFLTSTPNLVAETKVVPVSISDHDLVFASLKLKKERAKPVYIYARSYKHYNREAFLKDISAAPWSVVDCFDDVEDSLNAFNLLFNEILDCHAPVKKIKIRNRPNPFVTDEIRELMKTRDHWRKEARKTNDPLVWANYRSLRGKVKRDLRIAEREFIAEQIRTNPNNTRCLWKTIRSCIPKKSMSQRTFAKDDIVVANEFNSFFSSVGQTTISNIKSLAEECNYDLGQSEFRPRSHPESEQFIFKTVDCEEIRKIVSSMPTNKSPGIDQISMRVIKDSIPAILPTITSIINTSLVSGIFPRDWKMAVITPIPKDGDHEKANNNRPISLLPIFSKICERTVHNQMIPYLDKKQRLSTQQSGNRRFHSTETSLIETTDTILNAIDGKELTAVVLLDMSKAFDSIDHRILLLKLQDVGMSPAAINWFSSYLSERFQVVRINTVLSDKLPLNSGVPQGSILGPILFNIYVNELPSIPQSSLSKMYVDDNKLSFTFPIQQCVSAITEMNKDLCRIRDWCFDNRLLLNASKTKLMVFGSRHMISKVPNFRLSLLGKELIPVQSAKDLGVTFDPSLSFDCHVVKTVSSCMSSLAQINRVKHVLDKNLLILVIRSLVFSKLYYCSSVWANTTASNIRRLQAVQNFALRIITKSRKFDHITPLLNELHWIPVKLYLIYRDAVLTFKCLNGTTPESLSKQFMKRADISGRCTRNSSSLNIPFFKSATGQRTFHYRAVSLWNELPENIKCSSTVNIFKHKLLKYLLENHRL